MNKKIIIIDDNSITSKYFLDKIKSSDLLKDFVVLGSKNYIDENNNPLENLNLKQNKKLDLSLEPYYQKYNKKRKM